MKGNLMDKCTSYQQLLSVGLDETLSADQLHQLHEHLSQCPDCRAFRDSATSLRTIVNTLPMQEPSRPLRINRSSKTWWRHRMAVPLPAVAAGLLLLLASWLIHLRPHDTPSVESTTEQYAAVEQVDIIKLKPVSAVQVLPLRNVTIKKGSGS
jgi:hypothetical protein